MVAILSPSKSIRNSFCYNENKVKEGVATLIHAENYPKNLADMTENMRLEMLQKLAAQNPNAKVNSMHVTLNFDPLEQFSTEKMVEIACVYMDKVGFGNQPYLVYQHFDAGHPHLHLVTTNVEAGGTLIDLHHLGIRKSEPARKKIEIDFGLVKAEDQPKHDYKLKPACSAKVIYGRTDSRRAIHNVLTALLDSYNYGSLNELNALLGQYNVRADEGSEGSRVFKNGGLLYRILDECGNPVGVPIKASAFYNKPTLKNLEKKFLKGAVTKQQYKTRVKNTIDLALRKPGMDSLNKLMDALQSSGIHTVLRQNKDGIIYGITYVDHKSKSIFNGREIGTNYSAKGILDRFLPKQIPAPSLLNGKEKPLPTNPANVPNPPAEKGFGVSSSTPSQDNPASLLQELMEPEHGVDYIPYHLSGKKKKKKKRKINNN
ncbi:MAG: relaxase/mobilization nuclease domain-containing protein [Candidatus Pedobacter colombiensis]|uniref:Relaxase/mobilization nuclease domain-containing protein n=1 Tax=Candidatus Pedobacter colombiensis TaxID=3121371 RepID=A0AAJ5W6M0_9SPHI|nr:relaxase/mobilization nuclease domain-containing protein [Pedobacter sp.]WEK17954.1 MAG: relaxase/mobilization nuclease domain-containing protein [Pedobacter sp.]